MNSFAPPWDQNRQEQVLRGALRLRGARAKARRRLRDAAVICSAGLLVCAWLFSPRASAQGGSYENSSAGSRDPLAAYDRGDAGQRAD